jgi:peptidoglycan/xylan/chitin deacetylase (PgdA/CDA1 family)
VIILLYHRVADEICDPWALCVSPQHFDEQLEVLRNSARVIPISQVAASLTEGTVPHRSVVITFDDGYADNVHAAKPLLERYNLPATFFLVSQYVGSQMEFWWDELDRLFLQPGYLPDSFKLDVNGSIIQAVLGEATNYSRESYNQNRNWRAWEDPPTARHSLYYALWKQMRPMANTDRQRILEALQRWAGTDSQARTSHRALSHSELSALAKERLIEVGCHTMTHPQLSSLSPSMQSDEIRGCKEYLEEILGHPVESFAYPYGGQDDYTGDTVSLVRGMGFSSACSNFLGVVVTNSDRFQLPRVPIENWNGDEFEKRLKEWFREA